MTQRTFVVHGMTCGHCQQAVRDEVAKVPGVTAVQADLSSGQLTVTGDGYTDDQIRGAVDEAGYVLADA